MSEGSAYFDDLETRDASARDAALAQALPKVVARAQSASDYYKSSLAGIDAAAVTDRAALAKLPVTRKHDLIALQKEKPPFGGLPTLSAGQARRVFASPGPIHELEADEPDFWRSARAFHAAGFRKGDLVHNCFSYHLTPGGWIMDAGARALGCAVFPGGVGNSEQQAMAMAQFRPAGYAGTPDFLKVILEKADELSLDVSSIKRALVSGGALFPQLREAYAARGVTTLQCYATADLGLISYETLTAAGELCPGMLVDEGVLLEIVRPGTGDPVAEGEVGEVLVTTFSQSVPLIRFATGDLSALLPGESPCGRTNLRIKGWMGRADQTTKVKGMFIHPEQIDAVLKRHPGLAKARLEVTRKGDSDAMTLKVEAATDAGLSESLAAALVEICKLKGDVELVTPGSLPNDGKVIDDQRDYSKG
jgi:phenylacetate-CoA ligase